MKHVLISTAFLKPVTDLWSSGVWRLESQRAYVSHLSLRLPYRTTGKTQNDAAALLVTAA
jgi:hypothetical protein